MPAIRVNSQSSKNANLNINNNNSSNGNKNCEKVNSNNHNHHHHHVKNNFSTSSSLANNSSSTFCSNQQSPSNVFQQLAGKRIIQEKLNQIFIPPDKTTSILASFVTSSPSEQQFFDVANFSSSSNACGGKLKSNTNLLNRSLTMNFHDRQKFLNASFNRAGTSRQSLTINNDARCSSNKNAMRLTNLHDEFDTNINSNNNNNNNMRVRFDMKSNQNINPYDKLFVNRAGNGFKLNNSQLNYSLVNNFNELPSNIDMYNTSRPSDFSYNFDSVISQEKAQAKNNDGKCFENDKNTSTKSNHGEDDFDENSKEANDCICCVAAKINMQV
jgi:hypothetical protein